MSAFEILAVRAAGRDVLMKIGKFKVNRLHLELYTDEKSIGLEKQVEAVLEGHGIFMGRADMELRWRFRVRCPSAWIPTESRNEECKFAELATQEDFNKW